ncbi:MAG: hypothetical protein JRI72_12575 [Deltaproteobacteria bacterium]|nr:hypothetical protein [Deltaproteobacteria bacterium]
MKSSGKKTAITREPKQLVRGKEFHKKVQEDWHKTAEGDVESEKHVKKLSGRKGRMDICVDAQEKLVAVVELKASDWDRMTEKAVHRNVNRHASQIWDYIESQLEQGKEVSPGIIFPQRPKDKKRMEMIEELFEEHGIPVVWEDESTEERKARS